MKPPIYIFDLDGTLADITHRVPLIRGENKDWRAFFAACVDDKPIWPVIGVLGALRRQGAECWVWTGRSDEVFVQTKHWLQSHCDIVIRPWSHPERLMMRKAGDHRPDDEIKREWLVMLDPPERNRVVGVFEDRDRVVKMWRDVGLQCFQVAPGEF
jgi:hypothetical protein